MNNISFAELIISAFKKEIIKKLVFSRPIGDGAEKATARLCAHRGQRILNIEFSLTGNTVSQKNIKEEFLPTEIEALLSEYKQVNLLTTLGDAERKLSRDMREVLLGADKLMRKIEGKGLDFERAIESLDRKKNYILDGKEPFLVALGISDKSGRVHDKKQGKFRQINRFLEYLSEICDKLPRDRQVKVYDLCSGKSYLSFAVYHYLKNIEKFDISMLCIDLKRDVIDWCRSLSREIGFLGMEFICDDIMNTPKGESPDLVISLHACDVATDIVLECAAGLGAGVILSTPCCHRYLSRRIDSEALGFVTRYSKLSDKLCEALTDGLRLAKLASLGYRVSALELTDPENTPKNTLLKAIYDKNMSDAERKKYEAEYLRAKDFLLGGGASDYLSDIIK